MIHKVTLNKVFVFINYGQTQRKKIIELADGNGESEKICII